MQASVPTRASKQIQSLESTVKQSALIVSGLSDRSPEDDHEFGDEDNVVWDDSSEASDCDICEDIGFSTACLTELRPCLEQNIICSENSNLQSAQPPSVPFCLSNPARIYVSLIKDKFKQAQDQLVERLGEANWQRHLNVRKRIDIVQPLSEEEESGSVFRPYSAFHDSGTGTSVPAWTQYAPSHASFISSNPEGNKDSLRVPPLPAEAGTGRPFCCFICGLLLSNVRNRVDWKWVSIFPLAEQYRV